MLDLLTLLLFPLVGLVASFTAIHVYRHFETPPAVVMVSALPLGLAQVLTAFGARSLLGELVLLFHISGACLAFAGAGALVYVAKALNGRGLMPRTTPLPVANPE